MKLKEIKDYSDLYGWEIVVSELKKTFTLVSWAKNSRPTAGSLTVPTEKLNENRNASIEKVMLHRNGEITLITNFGWLRFLK